jgi:hypothetical protein
MAQMECFSFCTAPELFAVAEFLTKEIRMFRPISLAQLTLLVALSITMQRSLLTMYVLIGV